MPGGPPRYYEQRELLYVAISRVLSTPLFIALTLVAEGTFDTPLIIALALGSVYTASALAVAASRSWARADPRLFAGIDLAALVGVMVLDGGPQSQVAIVFLIWPIGMSLLFSPRGAAVCLPAVIAALAIASVPFLVDGPFSVDDPQVQAFMIDELTLLLVGLAALFAAYNFSQRQTRIERLSGARQTLLADALSAEDRARRDLSERLKGETLQVLLEAGQDLDSDGPAQARLPERAREGIRLAVRQLRDTIRDLHPMTLRQGGLAAGLDAVVERAGAVGGFAVDVRVDPSASGPHDALLISVTRELAANVAEHAGASTLWLEVVRDAAETETVLTVTDDGAGVSDAWTELSGLDGSGSAFGPAASAWQRLEETWRSHRLKGEGVRPCVYPLPAGMPDPSTAGEPAAVSGARPYDQRDLISAALSRAVSAPFYLALLLVSQEPVTASLVVVLAVGLVHIVTQLRLSASRHWARIDARVWIPVDLVIMAAILAASGGPESQMKVVFFIWPLAMSLVFPPRLVLGCLLAAITTYTLASLPLVADGPLRVDDPDFRALVLVGLSMAWIGTLTLFAADSFHRRRTRIEGLSSARQQVLAEALDAEDEARRRLSQALHDDALQVLLAAGQDLDAGLKGAGGSVSRAREELSLAVRRLREMARGLDPAGAESGRLAAGLDSVAERAAAFGGFSVDVRVDPAAAGPHDALLVSLGRELATNAAKHASAGHVVVRVDREPGHLSLEVVDDGTGIAADSLDEAVRAGHIGLASCAERVEAAGGDLTIETPAGGGTRVRATLPV